MSTNDRLRELLAAYGADPARWPAAERAAFGAASGGDFDRLLAEARRLDAILGRSPAPFSPAIDAKSLVDRVTETPQPRGFAVSRPTSGSGWRLTFGWQRLASFASIGVVGFIVGFADIDSPFLQGDDDEPAAGIFEVFEESPW